MSQRKKHTDADRLRYMHMIEDGRSINSIEDQYGMNHKLLKVLWEKYQLYGAEGIKRGKNFAVDFTKKKEIICDIEKNCLTLPEASLKYGPSASIIEYWLRIARRNGIEALAIEKRRGRPPGMGRPRKNSKPLTEVEKLRLEVEHLRTENALLKKVRALVEERNARLCAIGHEPSKD